jgi:hypothetical protein
MSGTLVGFHLNLKFHNRFSKNPQILNFMKICPVGTDLLHADKETEERKSIRKLKVAFRNFANAPNNHKRIDHLEYLSQNWPQSDRI